MADLPEHVRRNRAMWDDWAKKYAAAGERAWAENAPRWGIWQVPETELRMLANDLAGKDVIELGCGTAYVSSWLARRGARVVGIDNSQAQLDTARRLQLEHGVEFPLIHGNAEEVPGRTRASTSPSPSMARACGPTPIDGFRRPHVCSVPAVSSRS